MKKYICIACLPFVVACQYKLTDAQINAIEGHRARNVEAVALSKAAEYSAREATRQQVYSQLSERELLLVYQTDAMRDMNLAMASALASISQGKETNFYDFAIADSSNINAARQSGLRAAIGGIVGFKAIDAAADVLTTSIKGTGTKTQTIMQGDGNTSSHTSYDTRANTTTDIGTRGDDASVLVNNPPVTGPDQSVRVENSSPVD